MQNFHKNTLIIPNCSSSPQKPVPGFLISFFFFLFNGCFAFSYAGSLAKIGIRNDLEACLSAQLESRKQEGEQREAGKLWGSDSFPSIAF